MSGSIAAPHTATVGMSQVGELRPNTATPIPAPTANPIAACDFPIMVYMYARGTDLLGYETYVVRPYGFTQSSTMTITSPIHSIFRVLTTRSRTASHPETRQERHLNIPRRIDDPATAARLARELLHGRREDITLVLYMDDRCRFVGDAIVAIGWVQASRLSAHPIVAGAQASRTTGCFIVRYRRYGLPSVTQVEQRSSAFHRWSMLAPRVRRGRLPWWSPPATTIRNS